ncbi:sigma-E processing peptidase SpoIIGA [Salipaludibacillus aurantiacus]|uniref:Sporulation sigma-E factor-processing peptidase n=1 Tax=Salipaludibacillus aurantiacus TaxID=1601833 RepID=A0A1H9QT26_9BACI|nr:sigma-E processing peptidase SpoIIGA [Salipaludibacillus aurantiacus]SER63537.1 stage II sporulation protein GA (sporulation sigma-E factor processing peptidase) [Salipaludibacillus aurantiacus]
MTLYLDVIWLLNFFIDLLLLLLTSIVLKRKVLKKRLFAGAFFASMYVWVMFIPVLHFMMNPFLKALYSVIIILITFPSHQLRSFVQALLMFYFVNFAAGGGLIGLHFFLQVDSSFIQGTFATRGNSFGSPISWLFVIVGFPLIFFYSKERFAAVEASKIRFDETMDVEIVLGGREIKLKGFVDSGNQLTDPITKKPVMVIDMNKAEKQFPQEIFTLSKSSPESMGDIPSCYIGKVSIVPYRTVGTEQKFLWTIKPEKVVVFENGLSYECPGTLLGLSHFSLGEKGEYDCLLHPGMMQKRKQA